MKKKLIEVALPLEAINNASALEKSARKGHPSTLHLWWARRPLAACRAVLFASLVDDPSSLPAQFPTEADQDKERQRLFRLIEKLVLWENANNRAVLDEAHAEILKSTGGNPPPIYDPFCGGGSIPLEAQRLGLEAHGSDLNPVAVLITKALVEIPPKFAGQPPVNPAAKKQISAKGMWIGPRGLADDVRYYGQWMRDLAFEQIGHLYPKVKLPKQHGGESTVVAWLWARTIPCPNPACGIRMPLVRSFVLSKKGAKQSWVDPVVDHVTNSIRFEVKTNGGTPLDGTVNRRGGRCVSCGTAVPLDYIRSEGRAGRMSEQLMAIVAEGERGKIYISADNHQTEVLKGVEPSWAPSADLPRNPRDFKTPNYGLTTFADLFTARQLAALVTFSDLVLVVRKQAVEDGASSAYADAISTYLSLALDRLVMTGNNLVRWNSAGEKAQHAFGRQALPMIWDFAEPNFFASATGSISAAIELAADPLPYLGGLPSHVYQLDAASQPSDQSTMVICTDPPYYDNIGYGDLSDFFYLWLRRSLSSIHRDLLSTLQVPKAQELVATPYRFDGDREKAQQFFESGLGRAFSRMRSLQKPEYPLTVFYAFKQTESDEDGDGESEASSITSTGWETMLEGLLKAGFQLTGTWPMRTEMKTRQIAMGKNALASSIVLVCRPRSEAASITTRKDFLSSLKKELPHALRDLQKGNIAPVDLAQAAIGPGMAVFSRYKKVLETDGSPMRVRTALALINQGLDEVLSELESEFDPYTRWALAWFEQHQFDEGAFGEAEVLATAKALSISHLAEAGILHSRAGKVRLLRREELPEDWDPSAIGRLTVWEVTQHLIRCLDQKGEKETANLKAKIGGMAEIARDLAYRLYTLCERKGWADEAGYYNSLVVAWPSMASEAFELSGS